MGSLFSVVPMTLSLKLTDSVNCMNKCCSDEYIKDLEVSPDADKSAIKTPNVENMKRSPSCTKFNQSLPLSYNNNKKSLYNNSVQEYKCYNCKQEVNTKLQGSFHAIDKLWCRSCWLTKPWEFNHREL